MVVSVEGRAVRRLDLDNFVYDSERLRDERVCGRAHAEAHEFEEARVNYLALVEGAAAVARVEGRAVVGVFVEGEAKVVVAVAVLACGRRSPALDVAREVVRGRRVDRGRHVVVVASRYLGRASEPRNLGRDGRGRVAGLLLPTLLRREGAVLHYEVGSGAYVFRVRLVIGAAELVREDERVRYLVQL